MEDTRRLFITLYDLTTLRPYVVLRHPVILDEYLKLHHFASTSNSNCSLETSTDRKSVV